MKDYNQYTVEDIEDLERECERLAERVGELMEAGDELLHISERFLLVMREIVEGKPHAPEFEEIHRDNQETLDNIAATLRSLRRIVATPRRGFLETPLDNDLSF